MPQYPLVPQAGGSNNQLNITAPTVIKSTPGICHTISVVVASSSNTTGYVYDNSTTSGVGNANLIATIPSGIGVTRLSFPCKSGIVVVPGTNQVISVAFS